VRADATAALQHQYEQLRKTADAYAAEVASLKDAARRTDAEHRRKVQGLEEKLARRDKTIQQQGEERKKFQKQCSEVTAMYEQARQELEAKIAEWEVLQQKNVQLQHEKEEQRLALVSIQVAVNKAVEMHRPTSSLDASELATQLE